jgi:hypothetical protein
MKLKQDKMGKYDTMELKGKKDDRSICKQQRGTNVTQVSCPSKKTVEVAGTACTQYFIPYVRQERNMVS